MEASFYWCGTCGEYIPTADVQKHPAAPRTFCHYITAPKDNCSTCPPRQIIHLVKEETE
jgi:hypothetical protein